MRHRDVAEQVVVVHRATSSVGRATVLAALDRRARVVAVGTDARALAVLEADVAAPERLETLLVDTSQGDVADRIAYATTARFGLLHTWVHIVRRHGADPLSVGAASDTALRQLRRSGGGAFVVVAPDPAPARPGADGVPTSLETELASLATATEDPHDVVSVTLVRRTGIVPPDRVAHTILRASVRPRRDTVLRGSARRDALMARVARAGAQHRSQGAWLFR